MLCYVNNSNTHSTVIFLNSLSLKPVPECHYSEFYCSKDDSGDGNNYGY